MVLFLFYEQRGDGRQFGQVVVRGELLRELQQRAPFGLLTQLERGDGGRDAPMFLIGQPVVSLGAMEAQIACARREDLQPVVPIEHVHLRSQCAQGLAGDGDFSGRKSGK